MQVSRKQGISHFMTFSQILKCLKKRWNLPAEK
jgi:hypothetical protein